MMASLRNKLEGIASESKLGSIGKLMGLGDKSADAAKGADAATDAAAGASKIEVPPSSGGGARDAGQQARMQQLSNPNPAVATANDPFKLAPGARPGASGAAKAGDDVADAGGSAAKTTPPATGMTGRQKAAVGAGIAGATIAGTMLPGGDTQQTTPPAPGGSANAPGGSTTPAKPPKPTAPSAPAGSPELDELDAIARELAQSQEPLAIELMGQYNALRSKLGKAKEMPGELEEMIRLIKY